MQHIRCCRVNKVRRGKTWWVVQGMVGSGLCYVVMSWCVEKRGPVFTAAFSPVIQIVVAVIDVTLLQEQLHLGR